MIQRIRNTNMSLRTKLILAFLFTTLILFAINLYMYAGINKTIEKIDDIYNSNAQLTELQGALENVRANMIDYLNSKSSDSMENYYISEQMFKELMTGLNQKIYDNNSSIMEKNIYNMSEKYLLLTDETVDAKRGRNIEKYNLLFERSEELNTYINTYIYSLNNIQFKSNTIHYEELLRSLKYSETMNMLIMILVGLINIVLIFTMTSSIIEPLKKLVDSANEVASGNLEITLSENNRQDEVGVLTGAFNQMVLNLKIYIVRLKESLEKENELKGRELLMEAHLKDAKLKYLQAQINPHFLFNTLNAGAQLAMMEGAEKTYSYVQNVADFFRYNIKNDSDTVSLEEEIRLVDNYIYIINVRFSGDIHYYKDIDETLLGIKVPVMILQPVFENCINHGLCNVSWEKQIHLTIFKDEDKICISISDNGVGITKDKIEQIMEERVEVDEEGKDSNGIGLNNVINRLKLFYHTGDVMEITSDGPDMGTEIALYIPIVEI